MVLVALIQVMNVCGITTWGQTGYKVLDEAKRLIEIRTQTTPKTGASAQKQAGARQKASQPPRIPSRAVKPANR